MTPVWTANRTWTDGEIVTAAMMNQYLRDNLDYLFGRPLLDVSDLDGTVSATSSTSFTDITGASGDITSSKGRVLLLANLVVSGNGANISAYTFSVAGSDVGNANYGCGYLQMTTTANPISIMHVATITPDTLTAIKLRHRVSGGTSTVTLFNLKAYEL